MLSNPGRNLMGATSLSHLIQLLPSLVKPVTTLRPLIFIVLSVFVFVGRYGLPQFTGIRGHRPPGFVNAVERSTLLVSVQCKFPLTVIRHFKGLQLLRPSDPARHGACGT
jgi:hypothetical protein